VDEFVLDGVAHNLMFHRWLASHERFAAGDLSTRFIEEHFDPEQLAPGPEATQAALIAAALHAREEYDRVAVRSDRDGATASAWKWGARTRAGRSR
jgi:acetyl/propionyl-CoA carboxylase alpha subunit